MMTNEGEKPIREAGIKTECTIDHINDVEQAIHLDLRVLIHFEHPNTKISKREESKGGHRMVSIADFGFDIKLEFENERSQELVGGVNYLVSNKTETVYFVRHYKLTLKNVLDLHRFPFDQQIITITMTTYGVNFVRWKAPIEDMPSGFLYDDSPWKKYDNMSRIDKSNWDINSVPFEHSRVLSKNGQSIFESKFGIVRNPDFYVKNCFLTVYFIVQCSIFVVACSPHDFSSRASLTFTILLTLVAFKFVMATYVPRLPYFTILDTYNLVAIVLVVSVILENFMVSELFFPNEDVGKLIDKVFASIFCCFWVGVNMTIFLGRYLGLFIRAWSDATHSAEDAGVVGFVRGRLRNEVLEDTRSPLLIEDKSGEETI